MTSEKSEKRDSKALEPSLIADPTAKAEAEARNGLKQYDAGIQIIQTALERPSFKLRPSIILGLHREALNGISGMLVTFVQVAWRLKAANMPHPAPIWFRN